MINCMWIGVFWFSDLPRWTRWSSSSVTVVSAWRWYSSPVDSIDVNVDREMTHRIFMSTGCHRISTETFGSSETLDEPHWPIGWYVSRRNQPEDNIITNLCALERYTYTIHINLHKYNMILYYLLQRKDELMSFSRKSRAISNHWTTGRIWKLQLGEDPVLGHRGTSWYHVISPFSKKI